MKHRGTEDTEGTTRLAILSAAGSRGDVNPMIGIGRELKRLGFDVVISLAEPYVAAAEAAGLRAEGVIGSARFRGASWRTGTFGRRCGGRGRF